MIEPKLKPCKGTGNAKGYGCGKPTFHRVYGLGKMCGCYSDWLLNSEAGKIKLEKSILKATKPRRELEKAEKERKQRNTLSQEIQKTQTIVNRYIRERDKHKPCIASNIPWIPTFEAGHCYSKKQYSAIRFDYDNLHGQSINSNRFKDGEHDAYLINLPNRIGKERTEALKAKAAECKKYTKHWTFEELKAIQEDAKQKLKDLKQ